MIDSQHQATKTNYLTHYKATVALGLPIVIGNIGILATGICDTWMIGKYSTPALAAAAVVNNLFALVIVFGLGFTYGLTPLVGKHYAKGEHQCIGSITRNSLHANLVMTLLCVIAMTIVYLNIEILDQPRELLPLIRPYFLISLAGFPFIMIFNTFRQMFDGMLQTSLSMYILLAGNILNICGNYALIYGCWGLPEMGLIGAGFSTLLSRMLMAVAIFVALCLNDKFKLQHQWFIKSRGNLKDFIHLNRLGWPIAMQMGMETSAFSLSSIIVGWIGTTALGAHQIALSLSSCFYMVYYGFGAAVCVRVNHFWAQNDSNNARYSAKCGFHIILLTAAIFSAIILSFSRTIGGLFVSDPEIIEIVSQIVIIMVFYQFGDGLQCTYANALRGLSDVKMLMIMSFISFFIVSLPTGYLLGIALGWGLSGIWAAFPIGLTLAGILYKHRFESRLQKR